MRRAQRGRRLNTASNDRELARVVAAGVIDRVDKLLDEQRDPARLADDRLDGRGV